MDETNKIVPRSNGSNGAIAAIPVAGRIPAWDLAPREPHLYDYLLILRKHQWLILAFLLTVVTIVSIATLRMQPIYVAAARIEIDRENSNILPFQGTDPYDVYVDLENYLETQSKILQSETLAMQTIRSVGLFGHPDFNEAAPSEGSATGSLANQKRPAELGTFLSSLGVKRVPNSRLLDVSFESSDSQLASRVVNAHIENFIEQNFRSRYEATTQASSWLAGQLNELKIKVEKSEDARIAYERQNQIWTIDEKQNITTQRLADLNKELTESQSDRMRKEALYQMTQSGSLETLPEVRDSAVLQSLLQKRNETEGQYTEALHQYGPNFPKVLRLQAQIKELDQLVDREKKNTVNRVENDYRTARQRELLLGGDRKSVV